MSIIGPHPALWNQEDLIAERDRYGANDVMSSLSGWGKFNGCDELEIPVKAKLDGEFTAILHKGGMQAFLFDCRCLLASFFSVACGW